MFEYILQRLIMTIPTLFGITVVVFVIINLAPGSPIEQKLQAIRFAGGLEGASSASVQTSHQGVTEEVLESLKKQYGFDQPLHIRYWIWLKNLAQFDFGESFTYEEPVLDVIIGKFPVSVQFGVASFILSYLICIPLGILMAIQEGKTFDLIASFSLIVAYSIPSFMLAILLIVFFAGGSFWDFFPIGGLTSDDYEDFSFFEKIADRVHHFILPLICYTIGSFTVLTLLMKNSLIEEISKDYIRVARAKGLSETIVYLKHALRNALIPVVTGIGSLLTIFFTGSFLLETIFQLDGMGLLGYNSILSRDYNVLMALTFIVSLLGLLGNLFGDLMYVVVDPRIDFE